MIENDKSLVNSEPQTPQCQYFVVRKKRLCRMTVRPGRQYCGEHEPDPKTGDGQNDTRIPCPNDPKHTCYASKLQKHLSICNARQVPLPIYIEMNVNAPLDHESPLQILLSQVPKEKMMQLIDKITKLYDMYLKDGIEVLEEQDIHEVVLPDFQDTTRTENSLRHLRQVSSLLWLVERERLVAPDTCYVELGAGKGHLSYYLWQAWCAREGRSRVLLVDRASLRHKRDNKLRPAPAASQDDHEEGRNEEADDDAVCRVRAGLEHLVVRRTPAAKACSHLVGLAKHLCGAATDYALRCVMAGEARGVVVATCCHHRCRRGHHLGANYLQTMGITPEEFEIMLRIVSWATCGDGRSRERRAKEEVLKQNENSDQLEGHGGNIEQEVSKDKSQLNVEGKLELSVEERAEIGRRGKVLLDWARVLALREAGFNARLCRFVPATVSPENICIVASKSKGESPLV